MKNDPDCPNAIRARAFGELQPVDAAFAFEPVDVNTLAPEEQMARFLLWLKVHDAGHQPC